MMDSSTARIVMGMLILIFWGILAVMGKTPVADYINFLKDVIIALGIFHATLTKPGK